MATRHKHGRSQLSRLLGQQLWSLSVLSGRGDKSNLGRDATVSSSSSRASVQLLSLISASVTVSRWAVFIPSRVSLHGFYESRRSTAIFQTVRRAYERAMKYSNSRSALQVSARATQNALLWLRQQGVPMKVIAAETGKAEKSLQWHWTRLTRRLGTNDPFLLAKMTPWAS